MTYNEIYWMAQINAVDENKVNALVSSMLENGWQGCPILILNDQLLTGSHRIAALKKIEEMYRNDEISDRPEVLDQDIAEDVTDIVEENLAKLEEENGYVDDIQYDNIGWLLKGSWVEEYKDEIAEW